MWVSTKVLDFFKISQSSFEDIKAEVKELRGVNQVISNQLANANVTNDWLRFKVNQLEIEKAALMEKAYNIKLPVPEIARAPRVDPSYDPKNFSFDIGDELARQIGLPVYDDLPKFTQGPGLR